MNNKPIGIFDSGVGGLTVLKKLREELPNEEFIYFGDTARVPYGEKTKDELFEIFREILNWFKYKNIKAAVMACNTGSALVLEEIRKEYDFPIFGLIEPTAEYIAYSNAGKVGVLCTTGTASAKAYSKAINKLNSDIEVIEVACPGLVEIVEQNKAYTYEAKREIIKYVMPLVEKGVGKIILGCSHYPYLKRIINAIIDEKELLIDPADYLAHKLTEDLMLLSESSMQGNVEFYVSSNAELFQEVGKMFYEELNTVQEISIKTVLKY